MEGQFHSLCVHIKIWVPHDLWKQGVDKNRTLIIPKCWTVPLSTILLVTSYSQDGWGVQYKLRKYGGLPSHRPLRVHPRQQNGRLQRWHCAMYTDCAQPCSALLWMAPWFKLYECYSQRVHPLYKYLPLPTPTFTQRWRPQILGPTAYVALYEEGLLPNYCF